MNFNDKVLRLCSKIPKGKITTYKEISKKLNTKAYRAVGYALKQNKKTRVIPCHRVINSNGSLRGYKGKLNNKEKIKVLTKEGIKIKNNKVVDFEKVLFNFN